MPKDRYSSELGIHLTPLPDFCRIAGRGRLPADFGGIRSPVFDRGGLSGILGVRPASVQKFTLAYCTQGQPGTSGDITTTFRMAGTGAVNGPIRPNTEISEFLGHCMPKYLVKLQVRLGCILGSEHQLSVIQWLKLESRVRRATRLQDSHTQKGQN
jgi:hypothetical protein